MSEVQGNPPETATQSVTAAPDVTAPSTQQNVAPDAAVTPKIVGYDPVTGKPRFEGDDSDQEVIGYNPTTGDPIYRKKLSLTGTYEYFVQDVGTIYADTPAEAITHVKDVYDLNVNASQVHMCGLNSHTDKAV